jgi:SAM-dependent methyltransferase
MTTLERLQNYYHRDTCRLCDSADVSLVLKMAPCPPVDAYVEKIELARQQERFPMDLYLCHACGHAQLLDVVAPELLFGNYIYTTASSPGLVDYFREYADSVVSRLRPAPGALCVDIGSNDGTLLSFFKARDLRVLGIDPAEEIAREATERGIETIPAFFDRNVVSRLKAAKGPAKIITANNVFAHSDNLASMADGIRDFLAPDGVFICDVSYILDMVQNMIFDFIYHEHLSHHAVKPLERFFRKHGLHLFDVEHTPSKGGTLRCFVQLEGGPLPQQPGVESAIVREEERRLFSSSTYEAWGRRIASVGEQLGAMLDKSAALGRRLVGYGASATGTVLLYHFDLGKRLQAIIDDNPRRQGRFSPGHGIPIVSSQILEGDEPTDVVVLAWRFAEMITQRNQEFLRKGGRLIVPLPELRLVADHRS